MTITFERFMSEVGRLAAGRETLRTLKQGRPFRVGSSNGGFVWVPLASNYSRPIDEKTARRVLQRYNEVGSLAPGDYQDVTFNSSYYCVVFDRIRTGSEH